MEENENHQLRVLAVDAQSSSLHQLSAALLDCNCKAEITTSAAETLEILRANKQGFDVVLVDVDCPNNFNGFKLLEIIGFEMDIPVIMVTGDDTKENIAKGLDYGAQNFIIKPYGTQEVENAIWNRVPLIEMLQYDAAAQSGGDDDDQNDHLIQPLVLSNASIQPDDDASSSRTTSNKKRKKLVWNDELHSKFLQAYHALSKCSMVKPSSILDYMKEPGLTRRNVASHLQKFRMSNQRKQRTERSRLLGPERVVPYTTTRRTGLVNLGMREVNADAPPLAALPSSYESHSRRGGNAVAMSQKRIPYGGLLDPNKPYQSLLYSCLRGANYGTPDSRAFNYYNNNNYSLGMNIPSHNALSSRLVSGANSFGVPCFCVVGNRHQPAASSLSSARNALLFNQPVSGATSFGAQYFNDVASQPAASSLSSAPNALWFNRPVSEAANPSYGAPYFNTVASQPAASSLSSAPNALRFNQPVSEAANPSYGAPYFTIVASQPAATSRGSAALYPTVDAYLARQQQSTDASFKYSFAIGSVPNHIRGTGGIPNYGELIRIDYPNNVQFAGSNTGRTRNIGETEMAVVSNSPVVLRPGSSSWMIMSMTLPQENEASLR